MFTVRRIAGFSAAPIIGAAAGFAIIPMLTRIVGKDGWSQIAVGQSFGTLLVLVIGYGWDLHGPAKVALANEKKKAVLYSESFVSRVVLFLLCAPFCFLVPALLTSGEYTFEAGLLALGVALGGLAPSWYVVGLGKPSLLIKFNLIPSIILLLVAAFLVYTTKMVVVYPVAVFLASVVSFVLFSVFVAKPFVKPREKLWQIYRKNFSATVTVVAGGAYSVVVVLLVALVGAEGQVALYAAGEMFYRMALLSVGILGNTFQGWVVEGGDKFFLFRVKKSLFLLTSLGFLGFLGFVFLGSPLTGFVLGEQFRIGFVTSFWFGVAFFAIAINTVLGRHFLIPLGRTQFVMNSTLLGAAFGVPLILVCTVLFGVSGAAFALAFSEIIVTVFQFVVSRRCLRQPWSVEKNG